MRNTIIILTIAFFNIPLFAGLNCMSEYKNIEYVGWHSTECDCSCTYIKGRKCVECGHLQEARPLTVVTNNIRKITQQNNVLEPRTMKDVVNNLVQRYIKR
jgi:hypothetical protein